MIIPISARIPQINTYNKILVKSKITIRKAMPIRPIALNL